MTPIDSISGEALLIPGLQAWSLQAQDASLLQAFYDANPDYFLLIDGAPPPATAAAQDLADHPPADMAWRERWFIGVQDPQARTVAVAEVVSDLLAAGVWHIGLLIVATDHWGCGTARHVFAGLEDWARRAGARWLRLGVVKGNPRARRFWRSRGFEPVRWRHAVAFGERTHDVMVMVKPLNSGPRDARGGGSLREYLDLVPRDRDPAACDSTD